MKGHLHKFTILDSLFKKNDLNILITIKLEAYLNENCAWQHFTFTYEDALILNNQVFQLYH